MSDSGKLRFGMKTISPEEIDQQVAPYLDDLLEYEELDMDDWNSFGYGRRLFNIQQYNAWLTSANMIFFKEHSMEDLIAFLKDYQDAHYSHFRPDPDFLSPDFDGPEWGDDDGGLTIEEITENE
ncbi:MAG: hypothetical protein EOO51_09190 [Flavobacterium sp.]|nr:MAG: hypothetical protein EOO51_09190 [Flavobacterium sp.]